MKNLAIFASGNGTNMENILNFFAKNNNVNIKLLVCNNKNAGAIAKAEKFNLKTEVVDKNSFYDKVYLIDLLKKENIDMIILAGFLWRITDDIINVVAGNIINIHPALLPKYGGKGMYGDNVHNAVLNNKEKKTGITIHYVNNHYDEGNIIFQAEVIVNETDTADMIADKVHKLEYKYYPAIINILVSNFI